MFVCGPTQDGWPPNLSCCRTGFVCLQIFHACQVAGQSSGKK